MKTATADDIAKLTAITRRNREALNSLADEIATALAMKIRPDLRRVTMLELRIIQGQRAWDEEYARIHGNEDWSGQS